MAPHALPAEWLARQRSAAAPTPPEVAAVDEMVKLCADAAAFRAALDAIRRTAQPSLHVFLS